MKKILLLCLLIFGFGIKAQILSNESFEGSALPAGWTSFTDAALTSTTTPSFGTAAGTACAGVKTIYKNLYSTSPSWYLVFSSTASNGTDLSYSFKYLAKGFSTSGIISGSVSVDYSVDGGLTWNNIMPTTVLSSPNSTPIPCTTISGTIPAASIPTGANFKIRFASLYTNPGDYYSGWDEVKLSQQVSATPACTTVSAPTNAATNVSITPTFSYAASTGTFDYLINLGTTSGGTDVLNGYSNGTSLSYVVPTASALQYSKTYYLQIVPSNSVGNATGCLETSFTTLPIPCPSVSQPLTAATNTSLKPTVTWSAVTGATGYRLTVGTTSGGTDIVNDQDLGNVLTYTFPVNLNPSTKYYYSVRAYQGGNTSAGCTERNFTTGTNPTPVNDECTSAIALTVNADLACGVVTAGNTLGATLSLAAAPCNGNPDDDIYYSFVATNTTHIVSLLNVVATVGTSTDAYFQVLSGSCGALTSVQCSDPNSNTITGLTVGNTYYIRVYTYSIGNYAISFNICVGTPPPPPANDECANAVVLTVNPDLTCGSGVTTGTTLSATDSGVAITPCTGNPNDDVWYSFTATASIHTIALSSISSTGTTSSTALYTQVFSGTCGSLTSVFCSTSAVTTVPGLTPGETYFIRLYNTNGIGASNSFSICIGTPPPPPANDDCANAIALAVNPDLNCTAKTAGNTLYATQSMTATPCFGNPDDDVWYSFVATNTSHIVSLTNIVSTGTLTSTDAYFQVLSGSCGSLTSVVCSDPNSAIVSGLTVGDKYYIRVYSYSAGTYNIGFDICVGTPPPPPTNDNCINATALTVNNDLACASTTAGSTMSATLSQAATPCTGTADDDVWYSFVAKSNSQVITLSNVVSTGTSTSTSLYTQVLSGACGSLTSVKCGTTTTTTVTGLTIGQTYYIRVYNSLSGAAYSNSFNICVGTPVPSNDNCANAIALTAGTTFLQNQITATNLAATNTTDTSATHGCQTTGFTDVWYKVVVPASGNITIETDAVSGSAVTDTVLGVYSGACGTLTEIACDDNNGNGNFSKVILAGQTPGATLLIGVWNIDSTNTGSFALSAYDGSLATSEVASTVRDIKLYPNPFTETINISDIKNVKSVSIVDVAGRLVKSINKPNTQLNLPELSKGMYVVTLYFNDGSKKSMKVIKK